MRKLRVLRNDRLRNKCAMTWKRHSELNLGLKENIFTDTDFSRFTSLFSLKRTAFTLAEGATHVAHWNNSRKIAFTLAEVLITLGIIGVVAAMTLPSLIQNYHEKQRVTQLKKAYSVMQNAFLMAQEEYGDVTDWGLTITNTGEKDDDGNDILDNSGTENVMNILMKYVEKSKIPQNSYIGYVESIDGRQAFWPWEVSADKYFYLKDGTVVTMGWISSLDCNGDYQGKKIVCSDFWIVFPKKSKMKIGVDVFNFIFTTEGFKPNSTTNGAKCNAFEAVGRADINGRGCTAHALYNGNMDYLHKKDWQ